MIMFSGDSGQSGRNIMIMKGIFCERGGVYETDFSWGDA